MNAEDILLTQTCSACPEQYDAFLNGKQVGYLRLRHGLFYVAYPDAAGIRIYEAEPEGDGIFEEHERERYLTEAKLAIINKLSIV
jgi:hypothetical protein